MAFNVIPFVLAHQVGDFGFYPSYRKLVKNQWKPYEQLKKQQEQQLRKMIAFCYQFVPYYQKLFNRLDIKPQDINTTEDLVKLPVLNKEIIKQNWEDLKPLNLNQLQYDIRTTGGTSGTPLEFRLSKYDRFLGGAVLYRGWGYGGYRLGDKMVFLGGSRLDFGTKYYLLDRAHEIVRNLKKLSSFDMSEGELQQYLGVINSCRPKFMRGYASSFYFLAKWLEKKGLKTHQPRAIFTTAEKLYPNMREKISEVFQCDVFDTYGLHDGGVSAFECPRHNGLHIDTERAVMEVVDDNGAQLRNGEGRVLATSLYNYAMPFLRYETGDLGFITETKCGCGRGYQLLKEVTGRSVDLLITPEGKNVHGLFLLEIFCRHYKGVKEYQVVQEAIDKVVIKIVAEPDFDETQLAQIREHISRRSVGWKIEFRFVDAINRTAAGKYKFITNNYQQV